MSASQPNRRQYVTQKMYFKFSIYSIFYLMELTEDIRKDSPWDMLFADDIVLSRQNFRELEDDLEMWENALERRGLKVSRSKTEYLKAGDVDDGEDLKLQGEKLKRTKNFKYLGSTVSSDGRCEEKDPSRLDELEEGVWSSVRQEVISKG